MGKALKRLLAERRKLHKELPAIVEIKEQVVETIAVPSKVKPKKEEVSVVVPESLEDENDSVEASEELLKNALDTLNKKSTTKKK